MNSQPFAGRHRAKIGTIQTLSTETKSYAESLPNGELGPGDLALSEWRSLGLELPNLSTMRRYRLDRVRQQLRQRDYGGILLYDPLNIRYATDSTNMQVWCMHNAVRYCYIATEGPVVLFDFHGCGHLSEHLDLIDEIRPGRAWYYFGAGPRYEEIAERWAAEITDLHQRHAGENGRLAIDRCNVEGVRALEAAGLSLHNGEEVMELARSIKSVDEIRAMRCSMAACQASMAKMAETLEPGISEQRLWSVLHAENIARGGEWIETRLLASGPRTNPWFHECSSRIIEEGELVAFDTDLIGPYGYCADISRTWVCGQGATADQRALFALAREQIERNTELLRPGTHYSDLTAEAQILPPKYRPNRYSVLYHGVGLCDEYPSIYYPEDYAASGYEGVLQENMTLCVESYVGAVGGNEGVKLEEQILITADGPERISTYEFDPHLT